MSSNRRSNTVPALLLAMALPFMTACGTEEPVGIDYFNNLDKVKGGDKPAPPPVITRVTVTDLGEITINFSTSGVVDPETQSNANLYYFFYGSSSDPAGFADERLFYDERYFLGYVTESEFSADPKDVIININPDFHGTAYFWITAYDGGRESDHSTVGSVAVP